VSPILASAVEIVSGNTSSFIDVGVPSKYFISGLDIEPLTNRLSQIYSSILRILETNNFSHDNVGILSLLLLLSVLYNMFLIQKSSYKSIKKEYAEIDGNEKIIEKIKPKVNPETNSCMGTSDLCRNVEVCALLLKEGKAPELTNAEIVSLIDANKMQSYSLEKVLGADSRAVEIRRFLISRYLRVEITNELPFENYNYKKVMGVCCENVIGYVPIPLGVAGPYKIDGKEYYIPMATTEGCLIASTSRGCKAISCASEGALTEILADGMTRGPVVKFPDIRKASAFKKSVEGSYFLTVKEVFESTSRFAVLEKVITYFHFR
jgi:hypothetical protein